MKSIIEKEPTEQCYLCGTGGYLEKHHIFGAANRRWSEKYGLTVHLCPRCHRDNREGVHNNAEHMQKLQKIGQKVFERTYSRSRFMAVFGKNYLDAQEETGTEVKGDLQGFFFLENEDI